MTTEQLNTINEFKSALETQIKKYLTWGSSRCLDVIYFEERENIFLLAIVPDGISDDNAGMYVANHYFRIEQDGRYHEITFNSFQEKRGVAKKVISFNPNA